MSGAAVVGGAVLNALLYLLLVRPVGRSFNRMRTSLDKAMRLLGHEAA